MSGPLYSIIFAPTFPPKLELELGVLANPPSETITPPIDTGAVAAALTITFVVPEMRVVMPGMKTFGDEGLSAIVVGVVRTSGGWGELVGSEGGGACCSGVLTAIVGGGRWWRRGCDNF
jgi:hypothetical protein